MTPVRGYSVYTCFPFVRLFVGCQAAGQTGPGPSRETITKEIISSVLLELPTVSSYISTAVLPLNPLASFNFLYALFFGPVVSSTLFGFLYSRERNRDIKKTKKNTMALFLCVFGVWLTEFAEFIFTSWREEEKKYECLHCHWPLTCPAGWKGFLTHPSHASALSRAEEEQGAGWDAGWGGWLFRLPPSISL